MNLECLVDSKRSMTFFEIDARVLDAMHKETADAAARF
jgi:hypothetical protein